MCEVHVWGGYRGCWYGFGLRNQATHNKSMLSMLKRVDSYHILIYS